MSRTYVLRTILVWTLLELMAALQVPAGGGGPVLFSWLRNLIEPVAMVAQGTVGLAVDLGLGARGLQRGMVENREMRIELETLRARQMLLESDLAAFREIGDFAGPNAEFGAGSLVGRCTYRDLITGTMEIRTARSYILANDTPVVSAEGLVGRVIRSEGRRHWLQLLTHAAAAVAVHTEDSRVHGLALGTGSNALTIAYVPRQAELERGALLVTSGADGIYPPGIPAARVMRIRESDDPFLEVTAISIADLHAMQMVLILPEWAPAAGGGLP
jgi:rod shape-determining protein MreC